MYTDSFKFPKKLNPEVKVWKATAEDIGDVMQISGIDINTLLNLLHSGAECFLGSIGDGPPAAVTWSASGRCYIKGMGLEYDFGTDGYYSFWSFTAPWARHKGLYLALQSKKVEYEMSRGGNKFYGLIEFNNYYSYSLRERLGYRPLLKVSYLKLFNLKISLIRNLQTKKTTIRLFLKEPKGRIIII
jgi:hypothetical protein